MIIEIRLSNFFSIKDEVVVDMRAGNIKTQKAQDLQSNIFNYKDEQILKSVAIYGANASGKSNIIKAINFCVLLVRSSHIHNENTIFNFSPFKFENYFEKPSTFFIRFVIKDIEYEYSFSLTKTEFITEELYYYPNGRRAKIFTRNEQKGKTKGEIYSFASVINRPMDIAENTSRKTLYISRASQMDREIPKEIFRFFNHEIILGDYLGYNYFNLQALKSMLDIHKDTLLKAMQFADSDIVDFKMKSEIIPRKQFQLKYVPNETVLQQEFRNVEEEQLTFLTFHKSNPQIMFDFMAEESSGTQTLFFLMLAIIDVIKNNKILLIDEIENNLHTKIVEYILDLFHAGNSAQIIYTTHNTNLLNLDKLRKDQIYFVNKKEDGASDLYSLFDYKDFRDTMDVEKAYLQGRFDAIPYINDSFENLKSIIE